MLQVCWMCIQGIKSRWMVFTSHFEDLGDYLMETYLPSNIVLNWMRSFHPFSLCSSHYIISKIVWSLLNHWERETLKNLQPLVLYWSDSTKQSSSLLMILVKIWEQLNLSIACESFSFLLIWKMEGINCLFHFDDINYKILIMKDCNEVASLDEFLQALSHHEDLKGYDFMQDFFIFEVWYSSLLNFIDYWVTFSSTDLR